jgi:hypothetical protein
MTFVGILLTQKEPNFHIFLSVVLANMPILLYVIHHVVPRQTGPAHPRLELGTRGWTASWKVIPNVA